MTNYLKLIINHRYYLLVREHDGHAVVEGVHVDHVAVAFVLLRKDVEHVLQAEKSGNKVFDLIDLRLDVCRVFIRVYGYKMTSGLTFLWF